MYSISHFGSATSPKAKFLGACNNYLDGGSAIVCLPICRCVFGSNYPVEKAAVTFPQLLDTLTTLLQSYSARQRDLFFAGNARKIYQLGSKE